MHAGSLDITRLCAIFHWNGSCTYATFMLVWTAGTYLNSGQPDPVWPVPERVVGLLMELWNSAEPMPDHDPPRAGLRGSFLRDPHHHQWQVCDGVITLLAGRISESRRDRTGRFQALLLSTAP